MKKAACLLALLLLTACHPKETPQMPLPATRTVTFVNAVREADAWILPRTPAILKTTVWGTPTVAKAQPGESRPAPLREPGDGGLYVFRMIDADGFFYSADALTLEDGWTVKIQGNDLQAMSLEISDPDGTLRQTSPIFAARL